MIPNTRKSFFKSALTIFLGSFGLISLSTFIIITIVSSANQAIPIALGCGFFMSLFLSAHLSRNFQEDFFEINQQNKDQKITMNQYAQDIDQFFRQMRHRKIRINNELTIYSANSYLNIISGDYYVRKTLFLIEVKGPKNLLTVLQAHLGLKKIIL